MANYYIEADNKIGSQGKWILENISDYKRTKIYKHLKRENKGFDVYRFINFFDEKTFRKIETNAGGAVYASFVPKN